MEELIFFAAIAFTINKIVSSVKAAKSGDWNTPITQLLCFAVGILIVNLAASSDIGSGYAIPGFEGKLLGDVDFASIALFALMASSTGSFLYDWKKARDGSDTSAEPSLFPSLATNSPAPSDPPNGATR